MQSKAIPARADVVVVGGGIVGVSAALHLAKKGVSVTLCEKGRIAGEQSSRNWGWCRTMGRDPAELPLAIESLRLWGGMHGQVGGETGFRNSGIVYLCETGRELDVYEAWRQGCPDRGAMGGADRCHARRGSRDLAGGGIAGLLSRERIFRPRLRDRSRRRTSDRRSRHRRQPDRRSDALSVRAFRARAAVASMMRVLRARRFPTVGSWAARRAEIPGLLERTRSGLVSPTRPRHTPA